MDNKDAGQFGCSALGEEEEMVKIRCEGCWQSWAH